MRHPPSTGLVEPTLQTDRETEHDSKENYTLLLPILRFFCTPIVINWK